MKIKNVGEHNFQKILQNKKSKPFPVQSSFCDPSFSLQMKTADYGVMDEKEGIIAYHKQALSVHAIQLMYG